MILRRQSRRSSSTKPRPVVAPHIATAGRGFTGRSGFTLLEVILVLALMVVALGLLGMAVDVHLRVTNTSRRQVELSQLARLVLQQVTDDLRRTIPVAKASGQGGLRGNRQELQLDISRMPMLEVEPLPGEEKPQPIGPPADVRTVAYVVVSPDGVGAQNNFGAQPTQHGLLRRECERATFAWALAQGRVDEFNRAIKVLSPEVEAIEFTYFDGTTTYEEWDSFQQGKLPTAVRIAVTLRQPRPEGRQPPPTDATTEPLASYDTTVYLPNAKATLDQALAAVKTDSPQSAAPTNSSDQQQKESSSNSSQQQSASSGGGS